MELHVLLTSNYVLTSTHNVLHIISILKKTGALQTFYTTHNSLSTALSSKRFLAFSQQLFNSPQPTTIFAYSHSSTIQTLRTVRKVM